MKCSEASEQLIDLLYGELSGEARQKLEAHLAECPACAAEAKSLGHTAEVARAALAGPLCEEPPSRVREAVLHAAQAAVARRPPQAAEREGWLRRWLRLPWLFPAFGAVGVAAIVLLVKVVKDPQLPEPGNLKSPAAEAQAASAPAAPAPQAVKPAAPIPADRPAVAAAAPPSPEMAAGAPTPERTVEKRARSAAHGPAKPTPAAPSLPMQEVPPKAPRKMAIDDLLDAVGGGAGRSASPPPAAEAKAKRERAAESEGVPMASAPAPAPSGAARNYAVPPPAPSAPAVPAPQAAVAPVAPKPAAARMSSSPAEARPAKKSASKDDAPMPQAALAADEEVMKPAASDKQAESSLRRKETKGSAPADLDDKIRDAERLFSERRWAEAVVAFRALLLRAPEHVLARNWRDRISAAQHAQAEATKPAADPASAPR